MDGGEDKMGLSKAVDNSCTGLFIYTSSIDVVGTLPHDTWFLFNTFISCYFAFI